MTKAKFSSANDAFRRLLRRTRIESGMSQLDLASKLGMPQSFVSKYETGERRLDFVETILVCEALGMTIQEFAKRFSKINQSRGEI